MTNIENEAEWQAGFGGRINELFELFRNMAGWIYQEIPPVGTKNMMFSADVSLLSWLDANHLAKAYRREACAVIAQMELDQEASDTLDDFFNIEIPSLSLAAIKTFIAMANQRSRFQFFCYLLGTTQRIPPSGKPATLS